MTKKTKDDKQQVHDTYKGFKISACRSWSLAGFPTTYFKATRESDGWFFIDEFTEGEDPLNVIVEACRMRIDEHLKEKKK